MDIMSFLLGYESGKTTGGSGSVDNLDAVNDVLDEINGEIVAGETVTFMVEGVEWAKVEAAHGGTCANPVSSTNKPTKEPTVDKVFTFAGWSLTDDGTVDADALDNVTEDRTVYAVFSSDTREYTITFCDEDGSILETKTVAYGKIPSYTPTVTREDAYFDGWTPTPAAVSGSATYTIIWTPYPAFQGSTWEEIAAVLNLGKAADSFSVGDSRAIPLNYADGTSETIRFTIVDIGADTKEDGTPAQLTLMADNALKDSTKVASVAGTVADVYTYDLLSAAMDRFYAALPVEMQELTVTVAKSGTIYRKVFFPTWMNLTGDSTTGTTSNKNRVPFKQYTYFAEGNTIARTKVGESQNVQYVTGTVLGDGRFVLATVLLGNNKTYEAHGNSTVAIVPCICLG